MGDCWAMSRPLSVANNLCMAKIAMGPAFSNAAGKFSGVVISNSSSGLVIRKQARYKKQQNQAQEASMQRVRAAAAVWAEFDFQQAGAWDDYAQTVTLHNHLTGETYHPSGYNAFVALATKVLQIDPEAVVPVTPPVEMYLGDGIRVSGFGEMGAVLWTVDTPNSPGTTTELLLERLPNERRKPTGRLTSAGFHAFAVGSLSVTVPVEPGWYVVGYRYVEAATGRVTLAQLVGRVEVV